MTPALILALSLMASSPPPAPEAEPLPPGAPTDDYRLTAWCYGALSEYLTIYDQVKPDLVDINRMFGDPVKEAEPYQSDIAAARKELKLIGEAVTLAEKASPRPIAPQGAAALRDGRMIWSVVEAKTHRELARAWLTWGLPDRCDSVPRQLAARSLLLGKALSYNAAAAAPSDDTAGSVPAGASPTPTPAPSQPAPSAAITASSPTPAPAQAAPPTETTPPPAPPPTPPAETAALPAARAEPPAPTPAAPVPNAASQSDEPQEPKL
jgi:hypothetical protein